MQCTTKTKRQVAILQAAQAREIRVVGWHFQTNSVV